MTWWHKVALGTVPVVGVALCLLIFQIGADADKITADVHGLSGPSVQVLQATTAAADSITSLTASATKRVDAFSVTQTKLNTGIDLLTHRLTDLCSEPQGCGLIPDASRTLNTARGTLGRVEVAADSFDKHQSVFYTQEAALSVGAKKTFTDLDSFVTNPDLAASFHNLNTASLSLSDSAHNIDGLTADGRTWVHQELFPTKKKLGFWGSVWVGAQTVHKVSPPLF